MTTDSPTRYYAPQVRVVDAGNGDALVGATRVQGAPGAPEMVHLDVVSVTVTLVNTGISQLQLVLNNQNFDADGKPTTPPWKYNALDKVKFGQRLRVDMTYGEQPWTKMILAQVNSLRFTFPASGGPQLTVTGEDLGCLLKRNPDADKAYAAGHDEARIVAEVATRAQGPVFAGTNVISGERDADGWIEFRGSHIEWPTFSRQLPSVTHQKSQSYMKFLEGLAERMDFEIFVDFAKNYLPADETGAAGEVPAGSSSPPPSPDPTPNEVLLHFEPARSLLRGDSPKFVVDLAWGINLASFTPTLKVWDLFTAVKVTGRTNDAVSRVKEAIDTDAEVDAVVAEDLGRISGGAFLDPATKIRRDLLDSVATADLPTSSPTDVDFTNLDRERGLLMAKAKLRGKAREMCTAEAQSIGFPSLRPGMHVDITGLYAPFDGLYYVTKTIHTLDSSGYKTQLSLRRPGLQPPSEYPWAEEAAS
jgi:phage protein D